MHKLSILLTTFAFSFIILFGLSLTMHADTHGNMSTCPFMTEKTTMCPMGAIEHIAKWQETFTATISSFALLIILIITTSLLIYNIVPLLESPPLKKYFQKQPNFNFYNYLLSLFSAGILHPKIYA